VIYTEVPMCGAMKWIGDGVSDIACTRCPGKARSNFGELKRCISSKIVIKLRASLYTSETVRRTYMAALLVRWRIVMGNSSSLIKIAESWGVRLLQASDR
jgi:hypothetical protein